MNAHTLHAHRIAVLQTIYGKMASRGIDAMIVSDLSAIRWLTGFSGSSARLLLAGGTTLLFTDFRYREQAKRETSGISTVIIAGSFPAALSSGEYGLGRKVALQADRVTLQETEQLREQLQGIELVPVTAFFDEFRQIKHDEELRKMRRAVSISEEVLDKVIGMIAPGVTEIDIASEITYQHRRLGAEKDSFDPIVAGGIHAAMPHARPTTEALVEGSFVVIDMGCVFEGYASDQTRTVAFGKVTEEARAVYTIVQEAQLLGLQAAKEGITARELDCKVRDFIAARGYGEAFGHGLGHGVGIDVHESPRIGTSSGEILREGMVFTIEPGIYLEGRFGVRIEDTVLLGPDGAIPLQSFTKELIEV